MRELEKISLMHKRGKFGMPEKDFLELVMCPYDVNGRKDKKPLRRYLRERGELEKSLPNTRAKLKLAVDRAKFSQVTGIEKEEDTKIKQHMSNKAKKEDDERLKKEKERRELIMYSSLAGSVLDNRWRQADAASEEEESLVGPNRRRTVNFGTPIIESNHNSENEEDGNVEALHDEDEVDDEDDDDHDDEDDDDGLPLEKGPSMQRVALPLELSADAEF